MPETKSNLVGSTLAPLKLNNIEPTTTTIIYSFFYSEYHDSNESDPDEVKNVLQNNEGGSFLHGVLHEQRRSSYTASIAA